VTVLSSLLPYADLGGKLIRRRGAGKWERIALPSQRRLFRAGYAGTAVGVYSLPLDSTAQAMRASLFAMATTTTFLLYQPEFVPVGADQVSHVELTREVARRFNQLYPGAFTLSPDAAPWELEAIKTRARKLSGNKIQEHFTPHQLLEAAHQTKKLSPYKLTEILPEPQVLLTPSPKLPGLDGRKMSKSYGNTITLSEPVADLRAKLKTMVTDPARVRRDDPGNPEVCPVGDLHKVFSPLDTQAEVWKGCTTAAIGCIECKGWLADNIVLTLGPIQQRRSEFERQPAFVDDILADGANRARARAAQTIAQVHHVMGLD